MRVQAILWLQLGVIVYNTIRTLWLFSAYYDNRTVKGMGASKVVRIQAIGEASLLDRQTSLR